MSKQRWYYLALAVAGVLIVGILAVCAYIQESKMQSTAEQWQQKAVLELPEGVDAEQIRSWLARYGFELMWWNPHKSHGWIGTTYRNDDFGRAYIIRGSKSIGHDRWLELDFILNADHRLVYIEGHIREYAIPRLDQ